MAKKAQVIITGVGSAQKNAIKFLYDSVKDRKLLQSLADDLKLQIQKRTTAGLDEYKQKPLTESTIISRELLLDVNSPDVFTKPSRSNLTLTGQLLGSIRSKVDLASFNIVLFLTETRYKYLPPSKEAITRVAASKPKSKRGFYHAIGELMLQKPPTNKSNKEIKEDLEKQGRRFLFMSAKLQAQLEKNLTTQIRKQLSLYNKVKRKLSL